MSTETRTLQPNHSKLFPTGEQTLDPRLVPTDEERKVDEMKR